MKSLDEFSDEELFMMVKEGVSPAFEEIYNRYWDKLYAAAFKRTRLNEAAEEIVQELFVSLWTRRNEIALQSQLAVYLYQAVKYKVINHIHHESVRLNYSKNLKVMSLDLDNSTEETVMVGDLSRQLKLHIEHLPVKCREVFDLSRNKNKSNREIASYLGISEKTVENHITNAIKRLRLHLNSIMLFL